MPLIPTDARSKLCSSGEKNFVRKEASNDNEYGRHRG
jgi:hypothetical protein